MSEDIGAGLLGEPLIKRRNTQRRFKYLGERKGDGVVNIRLLQGDVRQTLATLPDNSVHCCVTSPPYYGLRDYLHEGQIGLEPTPAEYVAELVTVFRKVRRILRNDGTFWLNIGDSYAGHNVGPFRSENEAKNQGNSNKNGVGYVVGCKPKDLIGIPWMLAFALRDDGWYLRSEIIWDKPNSMPESVTDRPTCAHEAIFLFSKSERYFYDNEAVQESAQSDHSSGNGYQRDHRLTHARGSEKEWSDVGGFRNQRNVWHMASEPLSDEHFAAFPSELPHRAILAGTSAHGCCAKCGAQWVRQMDREYVGDNSKRGNYGGDSVKSRATAGLNSNKKIGHHSMLGWQQACQCRTDEIAPPIVLDPFSGAGTTALVAAQLRCHAIGIEINPKYVEMSYKRLGADVASLGKAKISVEVI